MSPQVVPKSTATTGQRILIPASAPVTQLRTGSNVTTLSASAVNQIASGATILPSGTSSYVMLPAQYVHQVCQICDCLSQVKDKWGKKSQMSENKQVPVTHTYRNKKGKLLPKNEEVSG